MLGGIAETAGFGSLFAWLILAHGFDNILAGGYSIIHGRSRDAATVQLLEKAELSHETATLTNDVLGMTGLITGGAVLQASKTAVTQGTSLATRYGVSTASEVQYQVVGKAPFEPGLNFRSKTFFH